MPNGIRFILWESRAWGSWKALVRHRSKSSHESCTAQPSLPPPGPHRHLYYTGKLSQYPTVEEELADGLLFYTNSFASSGHPLKSGIYGWRHWAHPLLSWMEKITQVRGWPHQPPVVFQDELCLVLRYRRFPSLLWGWRWPLPIQSQAPLCLYEAWLLEMPRTLFALNLSFWSTDIVQVGLRSGAAHCEPVTYPASMPATPSGQSQTACGFGHPGGPRWWADQRPGESSYSAGRKVTEQLFIRLGLKAASQYLSKVISKQPEVFDKRFHGSKESFLFLTLRCSVSALTICLLPFLSLGSGTGRERMMVVWRARGAAFGQECGDTAEILRLS